MEQQNHKYIVTTYKMSDANDPQQQIIEEASIASPLAFISGIGMILPELENKIIDIKEDGEYTFDINPEDAYGTYEAERVTQLDKEIFCVNGHFDHDNVKPGVTLPMQDENGRDFLGTVKEINADHVVMDFNHPLAGKTLRFSGKIIVNRDATEEEVTRATQPAGHGCGCHCGCGHEDMENMDGHGGCGCHHAGCGQADADEISDWHESGSCCCG